MQHRKDAVAPNHTVNHLTARFFKHATTGTQNAAASSACADEPCEHADADDARLLKVIRHELRRGLMLHLLVVILLEVGFHLLALFL